MVSRRRLHRFASTAMAVSAAFALAVGLSGCTLTEVMDRLGGNAAPELEYGAHLQNSEQEATVDRLRQQIWPDAWDPAAGGNIRQACDDQLDEPAYLFWGSWFTPAEATLPEDHVRAVAELREWLEADGWSELDGIEFTEESIDVNALGLSGSFPEVGIDEMQLIYYFEGDLGADYPHFVLDIDTNCTAVEQS